MLKRKPKILTPEQAEEIRTKDFFDMILPGSIKFLSDHYIVGDSYRCVWAVREYPPSTEEQAILSQLADRSGVTLRIYHRLVESMEQRKIIQNHRHDRHGRCPCAYDRCGWCRQNRILAVPVHRVCLCFGNVFSLYRYQGRCHA